MVCSACGLVQGNDIVFHGFTDSERGGDSADPYDYRSTKNPENMVYMRKMEALAGECDMEDLCTMIANHPSMQAAHMKIAGVSKRRQARDFMECQLERCDLMCDYLEARYSMPVSVVQRVKRLSKALWTHHHAECTARGAKPRAGCVKLLGMIAYACTVMGVQCDLREFAHHVSADVSDATTLGPDGYTHAVELEYKRLITQFSGDGSGLPRDLRRVIANEASRVDASVAPELKVHTHVTHVEKLIKDKLEAIDRGNELLPVLDSMLRAYAQGLTECPNPVDTRYFQKSAISAAAVLYKSLLSTVDRVKPTPMQRARKRKFRKLVSLAPAHKRRKVAKTVTEAVAAGPATFPCPTDPELIVMFDVTQHNALTSVRSRMQKLPCMHDWVK